MAKGSRALKEAKRGSGARFKALKEKLAERGDVKDPAAVAAAIGRAKYGAKKFQAMAAKGRKKDSISSHNSPFQYTPSDRTRRQTKWG